MSDITIISQPNDILTVTPPGREMIIRIAPDGRIFWHGREVETDDDFRAAMLDLADALIGKPPRSGSKRDGP